VVFFLPVADTLVRLRPNSDKTSLRSSAFRNHPLPHPWIHFFCYDRAPSNLDRLWRPMYCGFCVGGPSSRRPLDAVEKWTFGRLRQAGCAISERISCKGLSK